MEKRKIVIKKIGNKEKKDSNGMVEPYNLLTPDNNCNKSKYLNVSVNKKEKKDANNVASMVMQISTDYNKHNDGKHINFSLNNDNFELKRILVIWKFDKRGIINFELNKILMRNNGT